MSPFLFSTVTLVGAGMIGASIAKSLRSDSLVERIHVLERDEQRVSEVVSEGFADMATTDVRLAVKDADVVFLCTNIEAYANTARAIAAYVNENTIVSDVGSVKRSVIAAVTEELPYPELFVPAHPIAGTEKSGPGAGVDGVFKDRWCILTPTPQTDSGALGRIHSLWSAMGARVVQMSADEHDRVLAITSHLPHLIAYSLVDTAVQLENQLQLDVVRYSASGFRDFTRIAGSDPLMWRDIFLANTDAVLDALQQFQQDLKKLEQTIRNGDADKLEVIFRRTRTMRQAIVDKGQAGQFDPREPE